MNFSDKYAHVGYSHIGCLPYGWRPIAYDAVEKIEKLMWVHWLPMSVKRWIHRKATGGSVWYIKSRFWNKVRTWLSKGIITDIKEKYGSLRIYLIGTDEMFDVVDRAEEASYHICQECGHKGEDVENVYLGWVYTLCPTCIKEKRFGG